MRRLALLCVCITMVLLTFVGCGKTQNLQQKIKVHVAGLQGPTSIGMIKLLEEKPSLGTDIEADYQVAGSPDILVSKLISKEYDFATLPTNLAAKIYNKGIDYKVAAMNTWGVLYVVGTDKTIKEWKDLKGKKIYSVGKGTTPDIITKYLLNKSKLNPEKDVTFDYTMPQVELAQALAAGKVDLAVLPEPFVTMATMKNKNVKVLLDFQKEWEAVNGPKVPFAQTCLVVKGDFARNNPQVVDNFLQEYKKSIDWVNANNQQAGALVEKNKIGMPAKVAEAAIPRCNIRFEDAQTSKDAINNYLKVIFDSSPKDVGGKLPDENFYLKK